MRQGMKRRSDRGEPHAAVVDDDHVDDGGGSVFFHITSDKMLIE
jgi:hypothetical protein